MEQIKIDRISELYKKSQAEELTEAELAEQKKLREQYIADLRENFIMEMENVVVVDKDGNEVPLQKKSDGDHGVDCNCGCHHH